MSLLKKTLIWLPFGHLLESLGYFLIPTRCSHCSRATTSPHRIHRPRVHLFWIVQKLWRFFAFPAFFFNRQQQLIRVKSPLRAVWPDGQIILHYLAVHSKVGWKVCQLLYKSSTITQRCLKFHKKGKISPNLVTLFQGHNRSANVEGIIL